MADLATAPRRRFALLPTPLHPAPQLSAHLGVEVWFKRDDLTGLGLGGNKVRPLEYLVGDALDRGCESLVTGSGPQSNWSMLAACAARVAGLAPTVCLYGSPPAEATGNLALHRRIGTDLRWTGDESRASVDRMIEQVATELTEAGRRPLVLPRGGATTRGSVGYLAAAAEIAQQARELGIATPTVWLGTGSCGTQAGLVAGVAAGHLDRVVGVTVSRSADECRERVLGLAAGAAEIAGTAAPCPEQVEVIDGFLGPGYGKPSPEGERAGELVLATEGLFLDPPFCAKAMAALIASAQTDQVRGPVVFLVSGGAPTLFVEDGRL